MMQEPLLSSIIPLESNSFLLAKAKKQQTTSLNHTIAVVFASKEIIDDFPLSKQATNYPGRWGKLLYIQQVVKMTKCMSKYGPYG